jgi:uncharacterized repeat protein (TIGR03843 family)
LLLTLLREGEMKVEGMLPYGSNYTFLVELCRQQQRVYGVYKPTRGERPLWDFPENTLAFREVAAFLVSEALGWSFVPPTVFRPDGQYGAGSVQYFVQSDPEYHYFTMPDEDKAQLQRVAIFDILINNADRKGGHLLKDPAGKLWLIDHGIGFHAQNKLRTVIWDFAGDAIPEDVLEDMADFRERLDHDEDLKTAINGLLDPLEVAALRRRADRLLATRKFPQAASGRHMPWPPV